jgi:hypothetical protein
LVALEERFSRVLTRLTSHDNQKAIRIHSLKKYFVNILYKANVLCRRIGNAKDNNS